MIVPKYRDSFMLLKGIVVSMKPNTKSVLVGYPSYVAKIPTVIFSSMFDNSLNNLIASSNTTYVNTLVGTVPFPYWLINSLDTKHSFPNTLLMQ